MAKSKMKRKSTTSKAAASKVSAKKMPSVKEALTKGGVIKTITDVTNVSRKDVSAVFECLNQIIERHVKSGGPGKFVMPGLMKIVVIKKPATKAREGINPFTGEKMMFKAKPARRVIKIRALKSLKEWAS